MNWLIKWLFNLRDTNKLSLKHSEIKPMYNCILDISKASVIPMGHDKVPSSKKYKSTCFKRQLIHCLSKRYDHKLLRHQVLGLCFLYHRLCVTWYRTEEYFDWRQAGRFPHSYGVFFSCSEQKWHTAFWEHYTTPFIRKVNICTHITSSWMHLWDMMKKISTKQETWQ